MMDVFVEKAMEYAKKPDVKTVVISSSWIDEFIFRAQEYAYIENDQIAFLNTEDGFQKATQSLENMLLDLRQSGKKVYLILTKPHAYNPDIYFERSCFGIAHKKDPVANISRQYWEDYSKKVHDRLREIVRRAGVSAIDPTPYFCDESVCKHLTDDGKLMYKDWGHLCASYVKEHVHFLDFLFDQ